MVGRGDSKAAWDGRPGVDSYVAWDGSRHIGPPPDRWYLASDHRWWPTTDIIEAGGDPADPSADHIDDGTGGYIDQAGVPDPGPAAPIEPAAPRDADEDLSDWAPSSAPTTPDRPTAASPAGRPSPPAAPSRRRRSTNPSSGRTMSRLVASLLFGAIALGRCAFDTDSFDDTNTIPPDFTIPTITTLGLPERSTVPGIERPFLVNGVDFQLESIDCATVDEAITVFIGNPTSELRLYAFTLIVEVDDAGDGTETLIEVLETGPVLPGQVSETSFTVSPEVGIPVECIVNDIRFPSG